jgi:hypothetical protein
LAKAIIPDVTYGVYHPTSPSRQADEKTPGWLGRGFEGSNNFGGRGSPTSCGGYSDQPYRAILKVGLFTVRPFYGNPLWGVQSLERGYHAQSPEHLEWNSRACNSPDKHRCRAQANLCRYKYGIIALAKRTQISLEISMPHPAVKCLGSGDGWRPCAMRCHAWTGSSTIAGNGSSSAKLAKANGWQNPAR